MKKILTSLTCVALGAFLFTSCVKNEESDGVKAVREAQAIKIKAEADLESAEASHRKAETRLLEIDIQIAALGVAVAEASQLVQLEIRKDSLSIVAVQSQVNALKAALELFQAKYGDSETYATKLASTKADVATLIGEVETLSIEIYGAAANATGGLTIDINNTKKSKNDKDKELAAAKALDPVDQVIVDKLTMESESLGEHIAKLTAIKAAKTEKLTQAKARITALLASIKTLNELNDYKA